MIKKIKKNYNFPVIIEKDEKGNYVGRVPGLRSCYTQAKTMPELYKRLDEVISLCVETEEKFFKQAIPQNQFIGIYNAAYSK
jgi:predicted RNase H-like HicB family nuclease